MIKASDVLGYDRAKWAKKQPHKDLNIYWTTKLSKGVQGSCKAYYAVSLDKRRVIAVQQLWSKNKDQNVWLVGDTRETFDTLDEAKEFTKGLLVT
jgi:hypothetical protein